MLFFGVLVFGDSLDSKYAIYVDYFVSICYYIIYPFMYVV